MRFDLGGMTLSNFKCFTKLRVILGKLGVSYKDVSLF